VPHTRTRSSADSRGVPPSPFPPRQPRQVFLLRSRRVLTRLKFQEIRGELAWEVRPVGAGQYELRNFELRNVRWWDVLEHGNYNFEDLVPLLWPEQA
jgi:hypothetical protein